MKKNSGDPYIGPSFSLTNRAMRLIWGIVYVLFFRPSPKFLPGWRVFLLRVFGAKLGRKCRIYPKARVWAPWNFICEDVVAVADEAIIYNPSLIYLASHSIVSQQAYLCGATHDYNDPAFPLTSAPIRIGAYAWICARATVHPGIVVGEGAVLGLGAIATRNLDAWSVYAGVPARKVKNRKHDDGDR